MKIKQLQRVIHYFFAMLLLLPHVDFCECISTNVWSNYSPLALFWHLSPLRKSSIFWYLKPLFSPYLSKIQAGDSLAQVSSIPYYVPLSGSLGGKRPTTSTLRHLTCKELALQARRCCCCPTSMFINQQQGPLHRHRRDHVHVYRSESAEIAKRQRERSGGGKLRRCGRRWVRCSP